METEYSTVDPEMGITDVVAKMRAEDLHEIPVTEKKKLVGVVSFGSIIRRKNMVAGMKAKAVMEPAPPLNLDTPTTTLAENFLSTGYRQLPIIRGNNIIGIVPRANMITIIPKIKELKVIKVKGIMTTAVKTVGENEPLQAALELMRNLEIRTLPVVDKNGLMVGIIGIKDIVNHAWGQQRRETIGERKGEKDPVEMKVRSLAVDAVLTVGPDEDLKTVVGIMQKKKVSALPVLDGDKLVGIITMYDLVQLLASFAYRNMVYTQITGLEEEDRYSLETMDREIQSGLAKVSKIDRPTLFTMHVATHHSSGNTPKYSLHARLYTEHSAYVAHSEDWNLTKATMDLMDRLDGKITETKEERVSNKRKSRKES
jgi:CBS domain-containing protein